MSDSLPSVPLPLVDQRYAHALFDLAKEAGYIEDIEKALVSISVVLEQDNALKSFIENPLFSVKEQVEAARFICESLGFSDKGSGRIVRNFLCVVAGNRRLYALSGIVRAFQRCVALFRNESSVHVISACPLNRSQERELYAVLEEIIGGKIILRISVDSTILGGLIIRFGSYQFDTSLVTQLSALKLALKEEVS